MPGRGDNLEDMLTRVDNYSTNEPDHVQQATIVNCYDSYAASRGSRYLRSKNI